MVLKYLEFDYSEDAEGTGTFDAMAAVAPGQVTAVQTEIAAVLDWAQRQFPNAQGDLDDGAEWDFDLESQQEWVVDEGLAYDLQARRFTTHPVPPGQPRHTLTLSISGTAQFCEAFRLAFALD